MKKLLLLITVAMLPAYSFAQARLVLYEEFTGEDCAPCASTNPKLDSLMKAGLNPNHICMIKFMHYIPGMGPIFNFAPKMDSDRLAYYPAPFAPFGTMDGVVPDPWSTYPGHPYYLSQADITAAAAIASPFKMSIGSVLNTAKDSVTITVKVKAIAVYAPVGGSIKLRTARCKSLNFVGEPMHNGEDHMANLALDMYPDAAGLAIANTWAIGDSQTYILKGPVNKMDDHGWFGDAVGTDSFAVAWIQNDNDKKIAQATKEGLVMLPTTEAEELTVITDRISVSGINSNAVIVTISAQNEGYQSLMVTDMTGRMCYKTNKFLNQGVNTFDLNISDYSPGVYLLRSDNGSARFTKMPQ